MDEDTTEAWRRGDETIAYAVNPNNGGMVPAETQTWYKGVTKPADFNEWCFNKRAGWRIGVDMCLSAHAEMAIATAVALIKEITEGGN